jgi:hypothetical protein
MSGKYISKSGWLGLALTGLVCLSLLQAAVYAAETAPGTAAQVGELRIEGESIERLVLTDGTGSSRKFDRPAAVVTLPEGEYRLQEVALEGGYQCRAYQVPEGGHVTVSRDRPATLKVGAPLSQRIRLQRQGAVLALNFEIVGGAGELYSPATSTDKPHVTVYSRDKQILSADFEYG